MKEKVILKLLLLAGTIYFTAVGLVHFFDFKVPMLFIYYDIPSNAYQNRIIAVLCFAFAVFLFAGYRIFPDNYKIMKYIVIAGLVALLGLYINNYISGEMLRYNAIYWIEISLLALYLLFLYIFMKKYKKTM